MKNRLSITMISKNSADVIEESLSSVKGLADEIIVVDDGSYDGTVEIAKKFTNYVYNYHEMNLGRQRAYALSKASGDWIMMLDPDEVVSQELVKQVKKIVSSKTSLFDGYKVTFQNHLLGKAIYRGGENYKLLRLIKRKLAVIKPSLLHEKLEIKSRKIGKLNGKIYHYSYRSIRQMISKFTDYSFRAARQKVSDGKRTGLKKIFFYPIHMFWARFVKDKGYKDGFFRIPLDLGFAFMEFLTYFLMLFIKRKL